MAGETPILWSKLEDAASITSPELGTGGTVIGSPTYPAAKFNNGILSDANGEGCTFPTAANSINNSKGTIEFWAKMLYNQIHADTHYFIDFYDGVNGGIRMRFTPAIKDFDTYIYSEGLPVFIQSEGEIWSVNDLIHFALVWDREGNDIGEGKTLALFRDNVIIASSTDTWVADTILADMYVGLYHTEALHSDMVIDNLKTYNVCKIDFSDRETEGVGVEAEATIFFSHNF